LDLPEYYWAVQLLALSKKEALENYANQTQLINLSGARIASQNQLLYVLLLGIYETKELAKQAVASLPENQKKNLSPWIRSMGSLQTAMVQGDRLAKNSVD
jgi:septal ring-binding cell division protein DamX